MKKYGKALGGRIKSLDSFGEGVGFQIKGSSANKTYLGSIMSLLVTIVTLTYAYKRYLVMVEYGDST